MMTRISAVVAVVLGTAQVLTFATTQAPRPSPLFIIETDEFWLNLHHFLHVLGRAEAKAADASRPAVAGAPAEAEQGLQGLTEKERRVWSEAVTAYATGLSLKDALFDDQLPVMAGALAAADDSATLSGIAIDSATRSVLESAAPIYRKTWWQAHRASNQGWWSSTRPLVDRFGQTVLEFITRAYGKQWPASGYPLHVLRYAHPLGAYSTTRIDLVMSSNQNAGFHGLRGLEMAFHEAMHQWDDEVLQDLGRHASKIGKEVPANLPHAMIWVTAGEAVRRIAPEHVPLADAFNIWRGYMAPLKAALSEAWKPYLDGHGTRDEALAALVTKAPTEPRR